MLSYSDISKNFPLMDSSLIGFKAPPHGKNETVCSERTLNYIQLLMTQISVQDIEIQCSNIWSTTFRSQHTYLGKNLNSGREHIQNDNFPHSTEFDSLFDWWDRLKFLTFSSYTTECSKSSFGSEEEEPALHTLVTPRSGLCMNVSPKAKFFVIKSYNALDVATSVKNKIWASTDLGNKRLDKAFRDSDGEVYLFFSVNGSSKFCGVAKMLGVVDFSRSSDAWVEASRWKGIFSVNWLVYREISNKAFRLLRVSTNENKPVSNSRDTQELPATIGKSMLAIFSAGLV